MSKLLSSIRIRHYLETIGLLALDIIFFTFTNTNTDPSYVIIIGFVLIFISAYLFFYYGLSFLKLYGLPIRRKRRLATYLTVLVGALVALQSIGELTPKDVLVLVPIALIGYLYTGYAKPNRRKSE
jgi:hypothetical protein